MFSCRQATRLVSEGLDHPLTIWQRIVLRGHMIICIACRAYRRQVVILDGMIKEHFRQQRNEATPGEQAGKENRSQAAAGLSDEARARIKTNLHNDQS